MSELIAQVEEAILATFDPRPFDDADVVVAVPDATREVDYELLLRPLLAHLRDAGARASVRVALGLHRPMSAEELRPLAEVCRQFGVPLVQHDASGDDIVCISDDVSADRRDWPNLPACFPSSIVEADRLICVGSVEPHQYAGFSGGIKTIAIGCAGKDTIDAMHGLEFLRMPGTTVGRVEQNPFNHALWELGDRLPPAEALMFVPADFAPWHEVRFDVARVCYDKCIEVAEQVFFRLFDRAQDWLHLPVTGAKSVNFYQASRAATYAALVEDRAVHDGGLLVLEAECPEGVGSGPGERACGMAMMRGTEELMRELRGQVEGTSVGGQQRAFVLARALQHCQMCLVGADTIEALQPLGIPQFDTLDEALEALEPGPVGTSVDRPMHRIPRLKTVEAAQ